MRGVLLAILLISSAALADLFEEDLFAPGDGLLTRDTVTLLEWLDLTSTTSVSPDEILAGAGPGPGGWVGLGFSHATTEQVKQLFLHSGPVVTIVPYPGAYYEHNYEPAVHLTNLIGMTSPLSTASFGLAKYTTLPGQYDAAAIGIDRDKGAFATPYLMHPSSWSHWTTGNFLVRSYDPTPIPEPSTLVLLSGAIGLLLWRTRKRDAR